MGSQEPSSGELFASQYYSYLIIFIFHQQHAFDCYYGQVDALEKTEVDSKTERAQFKSFAGLLFSIKKYSCTL